MKCIMGSPEYLLWSETPLLQHGSLPYAYQITGYTAIFLINGLGIVYVAYRSASPSCTWDGARNLSFLPDSNNM